MLTYYNIKIMISKFTFIVFLFTVITLNCSSQSILNYTLGNSNGTFTALAGSTTVALSGGTVDEGYINNLPIGFDFWYMGIRYTSISASTNGWLTLGAGITNASPVNNLSTGGTPRPIIAPLWDDLSVQAATNVTYKTSGVVGSRVFTIQYLNAKWQNTAIGNTISFQVNLYESTGNISFVYRSETGVVLNGSASVGIAANATGSTNYLSLDGTDAKPKVNGYYETINLNTKPATGQLYSFTPPLPTAAPTLLQFMGISSNTVTLNWTDNSTNEDGYVIYYSTDGVSYSFVSQVAINATSYTQTGLTASTKYYWKVYAVTEGALSTALSSTATTICLSAAPVVVSPVNYCLNATATALTATGTNLVWNSSTVSGIAGGINTLSNFTYVDAVNPANNRKTNFTTTKAGVIIKSIDYFIMSNQAVTGLVLAIFNSAGTAIAISGTNTTQTVGASIVTKTNTFNYTIATAGNYSIGLYAGTGNIGSDNPAFPITETTGTINITGVSVAGFRCFNNIQFSMAGSSVAPVPSTVTTGTTNYTVYQTTSGCSGSNSATIAVIVNAAPSAKISYVGSPFCKSISTLQPVVQTGSTGGIYSATTGLTINAGTGAIMPNTSTAGVYTVTYTMAAAGGCAIQTSTTSATITASPTVSDTTTFTCVGGSTGTIVVLAGGGIAPYTYSINSGGYQSSASFKGLPAGNDTLKVMGNTGCATTVYVTVSPFPASADNQNATSTNTWIGHMYDGSNFNTYIGHFTEPEAFNDSFGGSTVCFNVMSNLQVRSIYTETFSVKFRMNSTRKGLYVVDLGSDDGSRLTIDGNMIYSSWLFQQFTTRPAVLLNLTGSSVLMYEYYENAGYNQVMFQNIKLVIKDSLTTNVLQNVCIGGAGSAISGDAFGVLPTGITLTGTGYQWSYSTTPAGSRNTLTGATGATYTPSGITAPFNVAGTYFIYRTVAVSSANNISYNPYAVSIESNMATVIVNPAGIWNGSINNNWNNPGNWSCVSVPTITTDVTILSGVSNYPVISTINAVNNITISAGASVTVLGGTLKIAGIIINSGSLDVTAGTLDFIGNTAQVIPNNIFLFNTIQNLQIGNNKGLTLGGILNVTGLLSFDSLNNCLLNTQGYLTLISNATGTASVADITNGGKDTGNSITGIVMVQRYHKNKRGWLLLTAPLTASGITGLPVADIYSNWQSNTYITGPVISGGLDLGVTSSYSMKYWTGNSWGNITDTKSSYTLFGNEGGTIADNKPFFIYLRGNRTIIPDNDTSMHSAVTINAKGLLQMGTKYFALTGLNYATTGNPYASLLDLDAFRRDNTGLKQTYYYWDPNLGSSTAEPELPRAACFWQLLN